MPDGTGRSSDICRRRPRWIRVFLRSITQRNQPGGLLGELENLRRTEGLDQDGLARVGQEAGKLGLARIRGHEDHAWNRRSVPLSQGLIEGG
jgi:hypothetical protein